MYPVRVSSDLPHLNISVRGESERSVVVQYPVMEFPQICHTSTYQ
jgi:hypothetical protein